MYNKQEYILLKPLKIIDILKEMKKYNVIIAGGAIRSVFSNAEIKDYDLYFKTKNELYKFEAELDMKDEDFYKITNTGTAITYKTINKKPEIVLQLITLPDLICENAEDIINQFDFTVCMAAYDVKKEQFILNERFLLDLANRELKYNIDNIYHISSLFRLRKYIDKGFKISGTEIIKLALCINNLKMNNYVDLKKQLLGIDTLFLQELTDKLMTPEYATVEYDFNNFMNLIDEFYNEKLNNLFE